MKAISRIGGMSWASSAEYYRVLNEGLRDWLSATASAQCLLCLFNFAEVGDLPHRGDPPGLTRRIIDAVRRLEAGGANVLLICANTMHRMAYDVQAAVGVPLLYIAIPRANASRRASTGCCNRL